MIGKVIEYATRYKWSLFPVEPRNKRPIPTGGKKDNGDVFRLRWGQCATNDLNILRRWWQQWPDANIGLACKRSGLVIIDADVEGLQAWTHFSAKYNLPETVTANTPSGGCHIIYRAVDGVTIGNRDLMNGVNVRGIKGDGGYVVIAPSIHPNGKTYTWTYGCGPSEIDIAILPMALIEALKPKQIKAEYVPLPVRDAVGTTYQERYAQKQLDWKISDVQSAQNGHKHNALNVAAYILGQFVGRRLLSEREVTSVLLAAAINNGVKDTEAERVINDGLRSGVRDSGSLIIPTLTDVRLKSIRQAVSHGG
jgi:putative DNA primase/helicase